MKRASTAFVIVASMLAVALLAPGASAKFTTHNSPGLATETDSVTCGDHISGRSGWTSLLPPDQIGALPSEATTGFARYDVFSFPQGWDFTTDEYVFQAPPAASYYKNGAEIAPRVLTFDTVPPRTVLSSPELAADGVSWVYAAVPFDEALNPSVPVGSTLGIGPQGPAILNLLTVVDCPPPAPVYTFTGFAAPVDNGMVNIAKAGSAIPLKFRVTDANGAPVTGLTTPPVAVTSKGAPCGTDPGDVIEEYAAGNSGLQDLGNGYYQFNWKTPKTYKGQCRTVMVSLGDGNQTHTAEFSFR